MSGAHPARSVVHKLALVGTIPLAIFVITLLRGLYPLGTRELWLWIMTRISQLIVWAINPATVTIVFIGIASIFVLGAIVFLYNLTHTVLG